MRCDMGLQHMGHASSFAAHSKHEHKWPHLKPRGAKAAVTKLWLVELPSRRSCLEGGATRSTVRRLEAAAARHGKIRISDGLEQWESASGPGKHPCVCLKSSSDVHSDGHFRL